MILDLLCLIAAWLAQATNSDSIIKFVEKHTVKRYLNVESNSEGIMRSESYDILTNTAAIQKIFAVDKQ